jgi:hypothetical protein
MLRGGCLGTGSVEVVVLYFTHISNYSALLGVDWDTAVAGGGFENVLRLSRGQGSVVAQELGVHSIVHQPALLLPEQVVGPVEAGESPAEAADFELHFCWGGEGGWGR